MYTGAQNLQNSFAGAPIPSEIQTAPESSKLTARQYLNIRSPRGQSPNTHDMQYKLGIHANLGNLSARTCLLTHNSIKCMNAVKQ